VVLVKSRRQAPGVRIGLFDRSGKQSGLILNLLTRSADENGAWVSSIETTDGNPISTLNALEKVGLTPLPPYILQARKHEGLRRNDQADRAAYQTVFARPQETPHGSVAAPTAGLHFTPELLERLSIVGIARAPLTLHVGTGTFKHVETEFVEQHTMHGEWCSTSAQTGTSIIRTRDAGGRIIAIGTTAARALESFAGPEDLQRGGQMVTRLLITPGFRWKFTDGLLTNFHLPRSTLLALVGAFLGPEGEGVERLKALYRVAIDNNYRFYSFGDAMLILP
jgi:S-adenosylmethionine:tRNA ribosyltransferase-isomerase